MKKTKEQKAITLVALIITIIVLLILAVVAIRAVTGDGIIAHAKNAQTKYEEAQDEENGILSYYETYLYAEGQVGKWIQNKELIKKVKEDGSVQELKVGDYINYNPKVYNEDENEIIKSYTSYASLEDENNNNNRISGHSENQIFKNDYTGTWQVLGVENGQILLVSSAGIGEYTISGKSGYQYGVDELNAICSIYGEGKGAESARSINVEDINKLTGFTTDKVSSEIEYGSITEYVYEDGKIKYIYTENGERKEGVSKYESLQYYDENSWKTLSSENTRFIIKNTAYRYYPDTLDLNSNLTNEEMNDGYMKLLFQNTISHSGDYWLADKTYFGKKESIGYGHRGVYDNKVGAIYAYYANGNVYPVECRIRAVVKLNSNINLKIQTDGTYNIDIYLSFGILQKNHIDI